MEKDPNQILIDLRAKFREATSTGLISGEQKVLFELTLISIINEAEENRQKCLKLKQQYEREAAKAEAQASAYASIENTIYNVFGTIVNKASKLKENENSGIEEAPELSKEEEEKLNKIKQKQKKSASK